MAFDTFSPTSTPSLQAPTFVMPSASPSDIIVSLRVELRLDSYPQETGWSLFCDGEAQRVRAPGTYTTANQIETEELSVRDGEICEFSIEDTAGDGMYPILGEAYSIFVDDVLAFDGNLAFGYGAGVSFCATNSVVEYPECSVQVLVPVRIEVIVYLNYEVFAWALSCDGMEIANVPEGNVDNSNYYSSEGETFYMKDGAQCLFHLEGTNDSASYIIYVADILVKNEYLTGSSDDFAFGVSPFPASAPTPSPSPLYPTPEPETFEGGFLMVIVFVGFVVVFTLTYYSLRKDNQRNQQNEQGANTALSNFAQANRPEGNADNEANLSEALEASRIDQRQLIEQALITRRVIAKSERSIDFSDRNANEAVLDQEQEPSERSTRQHRKRNLLVRAVATSVRSITTDHENPSSCDVCLTGYEVGEEVCWSPNEDCLHAFHKECIVDWLMTRPTCPCCRRNYLAGDQSA